MLAAAAPFEHDHSSLLGDHGDGSRRIGHEIVIQLTLGSAVLLLIICLLVMIVRRRRVAADDRSEPPPEDDSGHGWIWAGGVILPLVVITVVAAVEATTMKNTMGAMAMDHRAMSMASQNLEVIGHRWWWEVRYPGIPPVVTANQLVVPVGMPVHVRLRTQDVQHSFWIPGIDRKVDMVPGRVNSLDFTARDRGRYLGECMELCGLEHPYMRFEADVVTPAGFAAWLKHARESARKPSSPLAREGQRVLLRNSCVACHTIAGTPAQGDVGPSLTHLASRPAIGGGRLPNTAAALQRWITDPQKVKPGINMPATKLPARQMRALVSYLRGLR